MIGTCVCVCSHITSFTAVLWAGTEKYCACEYLNCSDVSSCRGQYKMLINFRLQLLEVIFDVSSW